MNDKNSTMRLQNLCLVWILVLAVISSVDRVHGQTQSMIEQAKKEGEAVLYTTMNVADFAIFNQALKEKYPFLNVRHIYLGAAVQVARVLQEQRAGKLQADVLGNGLEPMFLYRTQGVLARYESPEAQHIVSRAVDPEGYWAGITTDFLVTGFNTGEISRDTAPRSYEDYLKPGFKGKMAIDSNNPNALVGMINIGGEEKAVTYIERLGQQDVRLVEGFNHIASLLAAGEFPLAIFMQVTKMDQLKRKGAPVDWVPAATTFATLAKVGLAKNAPHPAAGRLLIDFYLSREGQQALARTGKIPLRKGVKNQSDAINSLLNSDHVHFVQPTGESNKYQKLYTEALRGR